MTKAERRAAQADGKAVKTIEGKGWMISRHRFLGVGRYVALRRVTEEDESVTTMYESDYTLVGLAASVDRRAREERR